MTTGMWETNKETPMGRNYRIGERALTYKIVTEPFSQDIGQGHGAWTLKDGHWNKCNAQEHCKGNILHVYTVLQ